MSANLTKIEQHLATRSYVEGSVSVQNFVQIERFC